MPQAVGDNLDFEVEQLWIETVKPALLGLEDEMADDGLVRELALVERGENPRLRQLDRRHVPHRCHCVGRSRDRPHRDGGRPPQPSRLKLFRARRDRQASPKASEFYYLYEPTAASRSEDT